MVSNGVDCGGVLDCKDVWQSMVLNGLVLSGWVWNGYVLDGCVLRRGKLHGRMRMKIDRLVPWHAARVVERKCRVVAFDRASVETQVGIIFVLRAPL